MRQLITGAMKLFTSKDALIALLGLDQAEPNEVFPTRVAEELRSNEAIQELGLPDQVIERMAFHVAKDQFEATADVTIPEFRRLFHHWNAAAGTWVRTGHNNALAKRGGPNARFDFFTTLNWQIVGAAPEGAILPDCVAIAIDQDGSSAPLMLADLEEVAVVLMPLNSAVLLQGNVAGQSLPSNIAFNVEAARASHRFFLASSDGPPIRSLQPFVDDRASGLINAAVDSAFENYIPKSTTGKKEADHESEAADAWDVPATSRCGYELSFLGSADEDTAREISNAVKQLVDTLGHSLPLSRLDGITFAADYPAALQTVERGVLGPEPPTTIDSIVGTGIAQTVNVMRNDVVKCRIVLAGWIGHSLISDDEKDVDWAISVLTRQLSLVALTEIFDTRLPGTILRPIEGPLGGWLYGAVGAAVDGYMASHISAGFGDAEELAEGFRELLRQALDRMRETVLPARLVYRYDGDLDRLLAVASQRSGMCCFLPQICLDTAQRLVSKRSVQVATLRWRFAGPACTPGFHASLQTWNVIASN